MAFTYRLSIRNALHLTIGGLAALVMLLTAHETYQSWQKLKNVSVLMEVTRIDGDFFQTISKLSEERSITYVLLHKPSKKLERQLAHDLKNARQDVDRVLVPAFNRVKIQGDASMREAVEKMEGQWAALLKLRQLSDGAISQDKKDAVLAEKYFAASTDLIGGIQNFTMEFFEPYVHMDRLVTRHMWFHYLLSTIRDYAGRERAFNSVLIIAGNAPGQSQLAQLLRWQGTIDLGWKIDRALLGKDRADEKLTNVFVEAESNYYAAFDMMHGMFANVGGMKNADYPISDELWFELAGQALESLAILGEAALKNVNESVAKVKASAEQEILIQLLVFLFAMVLCAHSFYVIKCKVLRPIHDIAEDLYAVMQGRAATLSVSPGQHGDEIGKLVQVLGHYQKNTEKIKRNSLELATHVKALERSNKELDDFAYIASHDLKEPLRGLHNHSRFLLEDNEDKLDKDSVDRLHRLTFLSQRMERLVNDLLYFSRLGRQDMAIGRVDINAVIHDIETTLEHFLEERNGKITVPNLLPTITCDQVRVTEVFRNLIVNALKYNESREKVVEIGFLRSRRNHEGLDIENVFYVMDNGVGIAPEFRTEVFRIFKRLQANKGKEDGTGVGLTFVKKIIERHGGTIWLESTPGEGTTFYFSLEGNHHEDAE